MSITLPEGRRSRLPAVFAVLGILSALIAGGTFYYTQVYSRTSGDSPEQVVEQFLTAVFADDPDLAKIDTLVCDSWDPAAAVERTTSQIPANAAVGWQDIIRFSTAEDRTVVEATVTLTPFADEEPSDFQGWAFDLIDEDGWRVCEARQIV